MIARWCVPDGVFWNDADRDRVFFEWLDAVAAHAWFLVESIRDAEARATEIVRRLGLA